MPKKSVNPWEMLARDFLSFFNQMSDERLLKLYQDLLAKGWNTRVFPLSTRNGESEIKYMVFQAISVEVVERREGRRRSLPRY